MHLHTLFRFPALFIVGLFTIIVSLVSANHVAASDCNVTSFTYSPGSPVTWGTHVSLAGSGECNGGVRAVRFTIDGQSKAEIGAPSQTETWKTEEYSPGSHTICFEVAGGSDSSWEAAARSCVGYEVTGDPTSDQCYVDSFGISPSSGPPGTTFTLSGSGHCDDGVRAVRFLINGAPFGEFGGPSHSTPWGTDGLPPGNYTIGFQVVHGDWNTAAEDFKTVTLSDISPTATPPGSDQCYVDSFDISPSSGSVGTTFTLSGSGHCDDGVRAVRFLINGTPFGEFGGPSHSTPWGTDGLPPGNYTIGFQVVHGDWNTAAEEFQTVTLNGGSTPTATPPSESDQCYVDSFDISPSSGPVGTTFTLSGSGHCDDGLRAVRFLINGTPFGEFGGPSHSTPWGTAGLPPGDYTIGFQVVHGDWNTAAEEFQTVTLGNVPATVTPVVAPSPDPRCNIDTFDISPDNGPVGTVFTLSGSGSCDGGVRAVRFLINGIPFGEFGGPSHSTPWGTDGLSPGEYTIGFQVVRGDWSTAAEEFQTVTLVGDTPTITPPPDPRCNVDSFDISPDSGPVGTVFTLSGSGNCDGGVRAVRFLINGTPFGEFGGPSHSTSWRTDGLSPGEYTIGFQVVHGDWSAAKTSSIKVYLGIAPPTDEEEEVDEDSDNGATCTYEWNVGNRVALRSGTQIRSGPGLNANVHTTVPEDNWLVDIIDGPRSVEGGVWFDISRAVLDGGGSGWVEFSQAGYMACSINIPPSNVSQGRAQPVSCTSTNSIYQVGRIAGLPAGEYIYSQMARDASVSITILNAPTAVMVVEGPISKDGYEWWKVSRQQACGSGFEDGWISRFNGTFPLIPAPIEQEESDNLNEYTVVTLGGSEQVRLPTPKPGYEWVSQSWFGHNMAMWLSELAKLQIENSWNYRAGEFALLLSQLASIRLGQEAQRGVDLAEVGICVFENAAQAKALSGFAEAQEQVECLITPVPCVGPIAKARDLWQERLYFQRRVREEQLLAMTTALHGETGDPRNLYGDYIQLPSHYLSLQQPAPDGREIIGDVLLAIPDLYNLKDCLPFAARHPRLVAGGTIWLFSLDEN